MSDSEKTPEFAKASPKAQSFALRLKFVIGMITAITALVVAISGLLTAVLKKFDERNAKTGYEELSKVIQQINEEMSKDRSDLIALRDYLEGYFKSQAAFLSGLPAALRGSISITTTVRPFNPPIPHTTSSAVASVSASAPPIMSLNPPKPDLPDIKSTEKISDPPAFEKIKELSDTSVE